MPAPIDQPRPRTYFATITVDAHGFGYQGLILAPDVRRAVAAIGETRFAVNADATAEAADRWAAYVIEVRVAAALGHRNGMHATVNLAAGTGQVTLAQGGRDRILATVEVVSGDSPLTEILGDVA